MPLDDIEELLRSPAPQTRLPANQVVWKTVRPQPKQEEDSIDISDVVPNTGSVFVKTWGCAHNNSDGEYMTGLLAHAGYSICDSGDDADLWLLNSCTVKNPSEDVFFNQVADAMTRGKKVVVAGCVPQGDRNNKKLMNLSVVGVQQLDRVVEVVEQTFRGNSVRLLGRRSSAKSRLDLPKIRRNDLIEILPINQGCLNQCTYCKTKHSRGNLQSYTPQQIVERARDVIRDGVVEIWLSSEDTGAYGRDIGTSLPEMLWRLVEILPPHVMLRIGMSNPPYFMQHLDEMIQILNHPRVYSFLHLPIQSGSDDVLLSMKREYTSADFCSVVDALRAGVPDINIATDVICGFPTETASDFEDTMALVEKYKFASLHISQFYARRGTPAARMKGLPSAEIKRRSREISRLFNSYETHQHRIGYEFSVLCTQTSSYGPYFVAHNKSYDQILVPDDASLMGCRFRVRIVGASKFYMMGEVIPGTVTRPPSPPSIEFPAPESTPPSLPQLSRHEDLLLYSSTLLLLLALLLRLFAS